MKHVSLKNKIMFAIITLGSIGICTTQAMHFAQETQTTNVDPKKFIEVIVIQSKNVVCDSHESVKEFFNSSNRESYQAHLARFAQLLNRIRHELLEPIITKLDAGESHNALILAQDILQNLLHKLEKLHAVLQKHQRSSAVALGLELRTLETEFASSSASLLHKLEQLLICLNTYGIAITEVQELQHLTAGFLQQNPLANKNYAEILEILRRRINCR